MERLSQATAPPTLNPTQLLWNYELFRTNKALAAHLVETKRAFDESAELTKCLSRCLNDLVIIISSIITINKNPQRDDLDRLRALRRQFKRGLTSLDAYADLTDSKSEALTTCVNELGRLINSPDSIPNIPQPTLDELNDLLKKSKRPVPIPIPQARSTSPTVKTESSDDQNGDSILGNLLAGLLQQKKRSLLGYFEFAKFVRHSHRYRPRFDKCDRLFVEKFIEGLNKDIYRRRIIHALRKEAWTWPWLEDIVLFLVSEEEYFEKQEYALAHRQEDGSVLLPDGTRQCQFLVLEPITDQDLTESESE